MSAQNTYAIIGMFAIVVTLYALRDSHAHYLPDLFGLALALAAPRQEYAISAVLILAIIRHSPLARGLAESVPDWLLVVVLPGARNMSISDDESDELESAYETRISQEETNNENAEIRRPVAENTNENILSAKAEIMARAILSGNLGLTEATRIAAGAQSGRKYQQWSRLIKMEMERQRNHYPPGSTHKRFE